jgi:hypothetical protein
MRISILSSDPGFATYTALVHAAGGMSHLKLEVYRGGMVETRVVTADEEVGFVDVYEIRKDMHSLHRLWGDIVIVSPHRDTGIVLRA